MNPVYEKLQSCLKSVRAKTDFQPKIALILGSGLGDYADGIEIVDTIDYNEIEGFPISTVSGHKGRFVFGYVKGVPVVIMQGRVHYYEGYPMTDVVLPTRLMGMMGAKVLFLTNASGGLNPNFHAGDFMVMEDQIANFVPSPLIGTNIDELGPRFPDMSEIYNKDLCCRRCTGYSGSEGCLCPTDWPQLRVAFRGEDVPSHRWRCCGHEHCVRSHCSKSYGNESLRHLLHHQHGKWNFQGSAEPYRSEGDC